MIWVGGVPGETPKQAPHVRKHDERDPGNEAPREHEHDVDTTAAGAQMYQAPSDKTFCREAFCLI